MGGERELLKVLIAVKTYPIPSSRYDELVCTAGVTEEGEFIRLYPINFRDLPYSQQYRKYQWIEVEAEKHAGRDFRKESYRPVSDIKLLGEPVPTKKGDWSERAQYVLLGRAKSMEDLRERQDQDNTSLGIFKPKIVHDLVITPDDPEWRASFLAELRQARLWEDWSKTKEPPRKLPFKFQYTFECDDQRCRHHTMMIEDWEVGALFWKLVDQGDSRGTAAEKVKQKFLNELCGPNRDTHLIVGTILAHPKSWVVIGVFYPKKDEQLRLFQ